jgi:hypothetical protein
MKRDVMMLHRRKNAKACPGVYAGKHANAMDYIDFASLPATLSNKEI